MATYNGGHFLHAQLQSILSQLGPQDEVVAVDDGSSDETVKILSECEDLRVRIIEQANAGPIAAFERAIGSASHDLIFLADQDDLWPQGRVEKMRIALMDAPLVAGTLRTIGKTEGTILSFRSPRPSRASAYIDLLLGRAPYYGSAMAFNRGLVNALPFPTWIEAHDHWIAVLGLSQQRPHHISDVVTMRRIHAHNLTTERRRPLLHVFRTRLIMLRMLIEASRRRVAQA